MNRRGFLKTIGVTGLAALIPAGLISRVVIKPIKPPESDPRDWHGSGWIDDTDINKEAIVSFHDNLKFDKVML